MQQGSIKVPKQPQEVNGNGARDISIVVPVVTPKPETYSSRHVEVGALSNDQAIALRHVFEGLQNRKHQLKNGRFVQASADAIRFLLEEIHAAL